MTETRRRPGDGTGGLRTTSATFEDLREQAVALRREGLSRRQIRDRLAVHNNDVLNRLLDGEAPPEWTKRPNAKDHVRARARELRLQGMTYDQIQVELGCSKSSISLWVRDLPKPTPQRTPAEQAQLASRKRWEHENALRDEQRTHLQESARAEVGRLSDRELFIAGVTLYWAERAKDKSYDRREKVQFINSDPRVIRVFLAWLDLIGVDRERIRYRVMIHESAAVKAAEEHWAALVGADAARFARATLKKHNPKTTRKNVGENYQGCLVLYVSRSADIYRRVEGAWCGIVGASS